MGDPLQGHDGRVYSVAFSHDGTRIVSGSSDKTVRIWDATTGAQMGDPLQGHDGWVNSVAFSHDGTRIVSGSDDKTLRIWDPTFDSPMNNILTDHTEGSVSIFCLCLIFNLFCLAHNNWNLSSDGWIIFPNCPYGIIWIPPQFHRPLWRPQNLCIISWVGYTKLSFTDHVYGKEWFHCIME
ncbi:WD40 repeat-like protein [Gymnopus androsaceus JB14]|uniref:WD40 repeat-like protein n=1 Tax=Gymnopus androsaceus JB14 TaxID=1447944 RepID=A0A6A4GXT7_9AGAR|nr:WD40 repeat-like protein [Gymnopus androsaceus JB14]